MATKKIASVRVADLDEGFAQQLAQNEEEIDKLLKKIAQFVRDDAKTTAKTIDEGFDDLTGNLRKSIGMRKSKFIRGGYIVKASGRNRKDGAERAKGFHAHLVEFGHLKVLWGKQTSERVRPHPFMRPALKRGMMYAAQEISQMKAKARKR